MGGRGRMREPCMVWGAERDSDFFIIIFILFYFLDKLLVIY